MMEKERLSRELMAARVARELHEGTVANLGIGMPTLVSNFIPQDGSVLLHVGEVEVNRIRARCGRGIAHTHKHHFVYHLVSHTHTHLDVECISFDARVPV